MKSIRYMYHVDHNPKRKPIKREWVEAAVRDPDWTEADPDDPEINRHFKRIYDAGGRYLRVPCAESDDEIRVITAFFDRGAKPL